MAVGVTSLPHPVVGDIAVGQRRSKCDGVATNAAGCDGYIVVGSSRAVRINDSDVVTLVELASVGHVYAEIGENRSCGQRRVYYILVVSIAVGYCRNCSARCIASRCFPGLVGQWGARQVICYSLVEIYSSRAGRGGQRYRALARVPAYAEHIVDDSATDNLDTAAIRWIKLVGIQQAVCVIVLPAATRVAVPVHHNPRAQLRRVDECRKVWPGTAGVPSCIADAVGAGNHRVGQAQPVAVLGAECGRTPAASVGKSLVLHPQRPEFHPVVDVDQHHAIAAEDLLNVVGTVVVQVTARHVALGPVCASRQGSQQVSVAGQTDGAGYRHIRAARRRERIARAPVTDDELIVAVNIAVVISVAHRAEEVTARYDGVVHHAFHPVQYPGIVHVRRLRDTVPAVTTCRDLLEVIVRRHHGVANGVRPAVALWTECDVRVVYEIFVILIQRGTVRACQRDIFGQIDVRGGGQPPVDPLHRHLQVLLHLRPRLPLAGYIN